METREALNDLPDQETEIRVTVPRSQMDLLGILSLQRANRALALSPAEIAEQGFVTIMHDLDTLVRMEAIEQATIAKAGNRVVGYVLAMTEASRPDIPMLEPLFRLLDTLPYAGQPLARYRCMLIGQVCVDKAFRGRGIFADMYAHYEARFAPRFDLLVTEISARNTRSLRAHARIGFVQLHTYMEATGDEWVVVVKYMRGGI